MIKFEHFGDGCNRVKVGNLTLYFDANNLLAGVKVVDRCLKVDESDIPELEEFRPESESVIHEIVMDHLREDWQCS